MPNGGKVDLSTYESRLRLSPLSLDILKLRYLNKNEDGKIVEAPLELFYRVASNIAGIDARYARTNFENEAQNSTKEFFEQMIDGNFIPASPILMNAGNPLQSLFSDHALEVPDSMEDIFEVLKLAATIQQHGGGVGFSFSSIRPHFDEVKRIKMLPLAQSMSCRFLIPHSMRSCRGDDERVQTWPSLMYPIQILKSSSP
ncbi:MAG: hypothetical protein KC535_05725 [Nanoarchaeota archaeon]|nr:hypothetical protein [Nanoarchaeota archaeon]